MSCYSRCPSRLRITFMFRIKPEFVFRIRPGFDQNFVIFVIIGFESNCAMIVLLDYFEAGRIMIIRIFELYECSSMKFHDENLNWWIGSVGYRAHDHSWSFQCLIKCSECRLDTTEWFMSLWVREYSWWFIMRIEKIPINDDSARERALGVMKFFELFWFQWKPAKTSALISRFLTKYFIILWFSAVMKNFKSLKTKILKFKRIYAEWLIISSSHSHYFFILMVLEGNS